MQNSFPAKTLPVTSPPSPKRPLAAFRRKKGPHTEKQQPFDVYYELLRGNKWKQFASAAPSDSAPATPLSTIRVTTSSHDSRNNMQFRTSNGRIKHEISCPVSAAKLAGVDLAGVWLCEQDLRDANFSGAHLVGANFSGSDLRGASFVGANLEGACFDAANLEGARLKNANLYWAGLFMANLTNADLENASLRGADLKETNLTGACLHNANLGRDNLGGATMLQGADLTGADLRGARLDGAEYDAATRLPDGFDPVEAGMVIKRSITE